MVISAALDDFFDAVKATFDKGVWLEKFLAQFLMESMNQNIQALKFSLLICSPIYLLFRKIKQNSKCLILEKLKDLILS